VKHLSANETVGEAMVFYRGKVTGVTPA
jgi:hypothetical protein